MTREPDAGRIRGDGSMTRAVTYRTRSGETRTAFLVAPDKQRGYADAPGTGPAGETCKTCAHYYRKEMSKAYRKCLLMKAHWTGGPGTDIKAGSPACSRWQSPGAA